jgi:hypothetical protein
MKVSVSEILRVKEYLREINQANLEEIEFLDDSNNKIDINPKHYKDFKFIGLNNVDFIFFDIYINGISSEKL